MSTDPKSAEQNEDGDPNTQHIQSSSPNKQQGNSPGRQAAQTCPNKLSMWKKLSMPKKLTSILRSTGSKPEASKDHVPDGSQQPASAADSLVKLIDADLSHMSQEANALTKYNSQLNRDLETLRNVFADIRNQGKDEQVLNKFRKELMKVKLAIPPKYNIGAEQDEHDKDLQLIKKLELSIWREESKKMPQLHKSPLFETSMEFKDFEARYEELEEPLKLCLLCFSIFPQGATIKKRLMLQWWVVERFASSMEDAEKYLKELMEKGFIEAVNNKRSLSVGSCRLHPLHRSALVTLAERAKLFNFGSGGDPTQNFAGSFQACLMGKGLISYEDFKKHEEDVHQNEAIKAVIQELEKLHLLMNVSEHILEFIDTWFGKMKNLNFLYLGRWKALATHHIEVEDPKFLNELGNMKHVKFLSLQGVSNIISLPQSILQLTNLDVLDLRACSNLETIPERIDYLEKLTHLDMSECYLLAHMPKGLSKLTNLKVLKGFFVTKPNSRSCTLADLKKLNNLVKLCIYTDRKHFHLEELVSVTKLTITWGVLTAEAEAEAEAEKFSGKLPPNLEKLDLKCFPEEDTPSWLKLQNLEETSLKKLKKLYIRGGKFGDLGQYQGIDDESKSEKKWEVEVLRLKYLGKIEMEWRQLRGLFHKLKYLEKVSCPNLTLFPCDAKGVWINTE